jgi:hypothetical protein
LEVRVNGCGFNPEDILGKGRSPGLLSMGHYATEAEPELSISSYPDAGRQWRAALRGRLTATMPVSVVLVDDPRPVRDSVKTIPERGSEFRVVGESESSADAVELCPKVAA